MLTFVILAASCACALTVIYDYLADVEKAVTSPITLTVATAIALPIGAYIVDEHGILIGAVFVLLSATGALALQSLRAKVTNPFPGTLSALFLLFIYAMFS